MMSNGKRKPDDMENRQREIVLVVNRRRYPLMVGVHWTLSYVLRDKLGLTGTKVACDGGACGACTVLIEGEPILSCMKLAVECDQMSIWTIEGLSDHDDLDPIQEAWIEEHGTQCGFCAPGMIMTTKAFLEENPEPSEADVRAALAGNICRCANYDHIVQAALSGANKIKGT